MTTKRRRRRLRGVISTEEALLCIMSRAPYLPDGAEVEIAARFRLKVTAETLAVQATYAAYFARVDEPERIAVTPNASQLVREVVVALRKEGWRQKQVRATGVAPGQLQFPGTESEADDGDD